MLNIRCLSRTALGACLLLPLVGRAELTNDTMLGPGMRQAPAYDGSYAQHEELVGIIRYLGPLWFVRSTQGYFEGGARHAIMPGLQVGAQLAYEDGRETGLSGFLEQHRVAGIKHGASGGLHVEWDTHLGPAPVNVLARLRQFLREGLGGQLDLRLSVGILRFGPVSAGVFTQATWENASSARAFYGLSPGQAAASGLAPFNAAGGCLYNSVGLQWSVDVARHWLLAGDFEQRHLRGDAAQSPLAERSTSQYIDIGAAYKF